MDGLVERGTEGGGGGSVCTGAFPPRGGGGVFLLGFICFVLFFIVCFRLLSFVF